MRFERPKIDHKVDPQGKRDLRVVCLSFTKGLQTDLSGGESDPTASQGLRKNVGWKIRFQRRKIDHKVEPKVLFPEPE